MPSKQQQAVGAQLDGRAAALTLRDVLAHYALLERAITRANLWHELAWHELAWDGEQAARDARRDVERGMAALARLMGE